MHWALMDDGREVVVDTARQQTRKVIRWKQDTDTRTVGEHFLAPGFVNVLLGGTWHTVKESRLKKAEYGNPFGALR